MSYLQQRRIDKEFPTISFNTGNHQIAKFTPWDQMKRKLISPNDFKPSYLKECEQGSRRLFKFDPKSASIWLSLSKDNTEVHSPHPDIECTRGIEKYRGLGVVFGDKVVSRGRCYWEVVVGDQNEYSVGVAYHTMPRNSQLGENNQSWVIRKFKNRFALYAMTMGRIERQIAHQPHVVGVLLDYEKGVLALYDAESKRHLHSFYSSFSEPCFPAFSVGAGCSLVLRPNQRPPGDYQATRPKSCHVAREYLARETAWSPDRPHHFTYTPPDKWRPPHAEKNWDGTWKMQRLASAAHVNPSRLGHRHTSAI